MGWVSRLFIIANKRDRSAFLCKMWRIVELLLKGLFRIKIYTGQWILLLRTVESPSSGNAICKSKKSLRISWVMLFVISEENYSMVPVTSCTLQCHFVGINAEEQDGKVKKYLGTSIIKYWLPKHFVWESLQYAFELGIGAEPILIWCLLKNHESHQLEENTKS